MIFSGIQRLAPLTDLPMPGISTAISSAIAPRNSQGAHFSQVLIGTWNARMATAVPITIEMQWRSTKWYSA